MTRKDYVLLSAAFASCKPSRTNPYPDAYQGWYSALTCVAAALSRDNAAFDKERFLNDASNQPHGPLCPCIVCSAERARESKIKIERMLANIHDKGGEA